MNLKERLNLNFAQPTKKLLLLGATGSIGTTTLNYLKRNPSIKLEGISIHRSIDKLSEIIENYQPRFVCITEEEAFEKFKDQYKNSKVKLLKGKEGLLELLYESDSDTVLNALVGSSGVEITIKAIELEKKICLANKESLVIAGPLILKLLEKYKAPFIPVDSEHNACFQLLLNHNSKFIRRILLTASGGPFRDFTYEEIKNVTKDQVLKHPTWNMGPKITVDSAGLINKGLEVIEAHYLFGFSYDSIDVKIHKNSYVHGMVELKDGSYICLISPPNMIFPIAYSLHFPETVPHSLKEALSPEDWPSLEFQSVDYQKYPGFFLCIEAGKKGESAPLILNSANEEAVSLFLKDKIHFIDIPKIIKEALEKIPVVKLENLNILLEEDQKVREYIKSKWNSLQLTR